MRRKAFGALMGYAQASGNPNWTKGLGGENGYVPPPRSEFEQIVARLKLLPEQYASSLELRTWAEKNWRQTFVPEKLLRVWHLSQWGLPDTD